MIFTVHSDIPLETNLNMKTIVSYDFDYDFVDVVNNKIDANKSLSANVATTSSSSCDVASCLTTNPRTLDPLAAPPQFPADTLPPIKKNSQVIRQPHLQGVSKKTTYLILNISKMLRSN